MFIAALFLMSINRWLEKENVVCPYNDILIGKKKEWRTDICPTQSPRRRGESIEHIFEEIETPNIQNLLEDIYLQTQEAQ